MADISKKVDKYKTLGVITRKDYDGLIKEVQADGVVEPHEAEELKRLFNLISSGELKVVESKEEEKKFLAKNQKERDTKYSVPKYKSHDFSKEERKNKEVEISSSSSFKKEDKKLTLDKESEEIVSSYFSDKAQKEEINDFSEGELLADLSYSYNKKETFELVSRRFLRVNLKTTLWMKVGSMVAYSGSINFTREKVFEHGISKMLKKALTGEGTDLTKATGVGALYLADHGKMISLYKLKGDSLIVNGNDLFAFENTVTWNIVSMKRLSALLAGGIFNVKLSGEGVVAVTTHFDPIRIKVTPGKPVYTDPHSTVAWTGNLVPTIRSDIDVQTMIGRSSGETFQICFDGQGDVLIQPFQETP